MITKAGVNHSRAAASTILEFTCLIVAAFLISIVGLIWSEIQVDSELLNFNYAVITGICIGVVALLVSLLFRKRIFEFYTSNKQAFGFSLVGLFKITLGYAVFFIISGGVLYLLLLSQGNQTTGIPFVAVITALAMSWTIGFITPGAPAGVGVREVALIFLLSPLCGVETATLVSIAFRVCTTLGELLLFVSCLLFLPKSD